MEKEKLFVDPNKMHGLISLESSLEALENMFLETRYLGDYKDRENYEFAKSSVMLGDPNRVYDNHGKMDGNGQCK